jgi:hypothetical protein
LGRPPPPTGRLAGAGAPKGNLNGLKHGRFSKRQAELVQLLMDNPSTRDSLIALGKRNRARRKQVEEGAGVLLLALLEKAAALALGAQHPPLGTQHSALGTEDVQGNTNQEFLDFLNAATTQIRSVLEKQSRKRRLPIKSQDPSG